NAVVRTRKEQVIHECRQLDFRQQPFAGVPLLLKDISQALKGEPLTAGAKLLSSYQPKRDSNFVAKLLGAGFL
ncbi:amidase family protein, partial [Bacillus thuringiensis]|uniref:amidase family protein n=1 Tax=Bacillus thuringiensis TaxID=1428 RepID=UPI0020BF8389